MWETLDVDRLDALERDWGEEPLTDRLVAAFLGHKSAKAKPTAKPTDLLGMFPSGTIGPGH